MLLFLEIRTDWSPSKFEFGKFGASNFSERLEPSIRKDGGTPSYLLTRAVEEKIFSKIS